jgi:hypothetical protein
MCTEHALTGVNSKPAWRAARLQSILHRSAQQNKRQERVQEEGRSLCIMAITGVTAINGDPSCGDIWITGVCWRYL